MFAETASFCTLCLEQSEKCIRMVAAGLLLLMSAPLVFAFLLDLFLGFTGFVWARLHRYSYKKLVGRIDLNLNIRSSNPLREFLRLKQFVLSPSWMIRAEDDH